jgi:hypothetical protein
MPDFLVITRLWPFALISTTIMMFWLHRYLGLSKVWFFQTSSSAIAFGLARFWYYVAPFLGLAFLLFGISATVGSDPHSMIPVYWVFGGWGCIILGFILGFLQPSWLSPTWLRRLKQEYGNAMINLLIEDAVGMNKSQLEQRLATWEDIEGWVAEVRHNRGL